MAERFSGEWRTIRLKEAAGKSGRFFDGDWVLTKDYDAIGNIRLIQLQDIGEGQLLNKSNKRINEATFKQLKCKELKAGDVIISRMAPNVGRCCIIPELPYRVITVVDVAVMRCDERIIHNKYFSYVCNSSIVIHEATRLSRGTTRKRTPRSTIGDILIPLPPLDEQIAIADTLSAFDRHLANLSELIAKHEGIRAGALEDLLSGRTRLPGFRGAWRTVKLGELGKVKMCRRVFHSQTQSYGQVPFFKIGTFNTEPDAYISRELFEEYKRLYPYPKKGNVLLSAAGTIGRTFFFDGRDAYFQDSNIVWLDADPAKVDGRFLMYFYQTYPWRNLEGTAIRRLYNKMILDTAINLPPVDEQIAIAETLSALDLNISNLKAEHAKISALRTAAINDLLTAKIRLPRAH